MAEVIIKLDPDDPDDKDKLEMFQYGWKYRSVLQEMDNYLRALIKYKDLPEAVEEALDTARSKLFELADDSDVKVWE